MKLFDYAALFGALIITILSFSSAYSVQSESLEISIQSEEQEWIYPLNASLSRSFPGPAGETVIEIKDGLVSVLHSDCSEQICVQSGTIKEQSQWIACMPNRIFITIRGKKEGELDGEVY